MNQSFNAKLEAKGPGGAWTFMPIPFDVQVAFGSKARVAVAGTMNGFPFQNSVMPEGDGTHAMSVSREFQGAAGVKAGDFVAVVMWKDEEERTIAAPGDLTSALAHDEMATALFENLTYSQKKEYIEWIGAAKQEATRKNRIGKAVEMLAAGKRRTR